MKLLIVDDDLIVREGMCRRIQEVFDDALEVHTTGSSVDALDWILRDPPDIVLTDICMPNIDGLELIEKTLAAGRKPHFIIVSGHADFAYARQAMKFNVADFIVKPVDETELFKNLHAILEKEEKNTLKKHQKEKAMKLDHYLKHGLQMGFSHGMESGYPGISFGQLFPYPYFTLMAIPTKIFPEEPTLGTLTETCVDGKKAVFCLLEYRKWLTVCIISHSWEGPGIPQPLITQVRQILKIDADILIGVSTTRKGWDSLPKALNEATSASYLRLYGKSEVAYFGQHIMRAVTTINPGECLLRLKQSMEQDDLESIARILEEFYQNARTKAVNPKDYVNVSKHMLLQLEDVPGVIGNNVSRIDLTSVLEQYDYLCRFGTSEDVLSYMVDAIARIMHTTSETKKPYSLVVIKMLHYVQDNLDKPIELKTIATEFQKSQNYLGTLFKKEVGLGFLNYVTKRKMERAKELMQQDPEIRIYELAEKLGYLDVKYFTRTFKQFYGVTPGQMRSKQNIYDVHYLQGQKNDNLE